MKIPRINIDKIRKTKNVDYTFVAVVLILLAYGLIMVFSASSASAHYRMNDTFYFIKRQALWAFLGLGGMAFFSSVPYKFYYTSTLKLRLFAIRAPSTPTATAASSTVAEDTSNSRIRSSIPNPLKYSLTFSIDISCCSCFLYSKFSS